MFKRKWLKIVDELPNLQDGNWFVSIDSGLSTSDTADYSAISFVYGNEDGYYVLFAERGRWDYETLKARATSYARRRKVHFIVEAAGVGYSLISALRNAGQYCFTYKPKDSKLSRAAWALPIVQAGRVHILNRAGHNKWVEPYINEILTFPYGRYDDQVDSLSQLLPWAERRFNAGVQYFQKGEI